MTDAPIEAGDLEEARAALRALVEASGMSRRALDELAGLPLGYTDKLLCEPPIKNLGPVSFFAILGACAHRIRFVPDPVARERLRRHHKFVQRVEHKRRGSDHWSNAKALALAQVWGRQGAQKLLKSLTKDQISDQRRRAAKKRWREVRKARREAQIAAKFGALPISQSSGIARGRQNKSPPQPSSRSEARTVRRR